MSKNESTPNNHDFDIEIEYLPNINEIDNLLTLVDKFSELYDYSNEIIPVINIFNKTMNEIESNINTSEDNSHINNLLLIGVISAFEGFVHEILKISLNKPIYISNAMKNLNEHHKSPIIESHTLKGVKNITELKKTLLSASISNPTKLSRISSILFGFPSHNIDEKYTDSLITIRNSIIHKNGYLNGEYLKISTNELIKAYNYYYSSVQSYVDEINLHLEKTSPL